MDKETTVGRIIFNPILPNEVEYVNEIINKKNPDKNC